MLDWEETIKNIAFAQQGDEKAKTTLIENNAPLIKSIVRRYKNKGVEYDDLYQLGCVGLLKAIKNFNVNHGVKFSTYAVPMIMGEIKRYLRDDGYIKVSRATKSLAVKIAYFIDEIKNSNGRTPSIEEIANHFNIDAQEVVFSMDSTKIPLSLYDKGNDEQGISLYEKITLGDETDKKINEIVIKDAIAKLSERERELIVLRYYRDKTQSEVAKVLKVSQVQISRLESKIIKKLRESFN